MATSRRALLVTLVLGAALLAAAPAGAAVPAARHCVAVLDTSPAAGQAAAVARRPRAHCFGSFTEALGWASGAAAVRGARPSRVATASSSHVLGILHQHADFGGGSLTLAGSAPCGRGSVARYDLTGLFDGRTSSAEARSGCRQLVLFDRANATGSFVTCGTTCSWVGAAMNDRASAVAVKG